MSSFVFVEPTRDFYNNLVKVSHKGQMYGSKPYTFHLRHVTKCWSNLFEVDYSYDLSKEETQAVIKYTDEANFATLGHDLVEDCAGITEEVLKSHSVPDASIKAIYLCTKTEEVSYKQYLRNICEDKLSFEVKVSDTYSNLTHSIKGGSFKRVKKYSEQLRLLYKFREEFLEEGK